MVTIAEIREYAEEIGPGVIADRRFLHQHPELGFQEHETARFVADRLRTYNLDEVQTGIAQTGDRRRSCTAARGRGAASSYAPTWTPCR